MSVDSYDVVAEKVLFDLESAIKKYTNIDEFYIIPTSEEENKNSSPVIKAENTLGLESWIVSHIYPYAHHQIMEKNNYKSQNLAKVIACLTGVALLNPEMPTTWNRRRELIISKKLHIDNELRLTRMVLSRKPKCNDALTHRRWVIMEILENFQDKSTILSEELKLSEMIANRYHSNYHAWSHRMWSLQHLLPDSPFHVKKRSPKNCFFEASHVELFEAMSRSITRSEFLYVRNSDISRIYFEEFENNFKWVSSHVSDHSGLHFRKFLITEILSFLKNYLTLSDRMEIENEMETSRWNSSCIFTNGKINLTEFLDFHGPDDRHKRAFQEYLINLEHELTLFDLAMFLIVTELKSNYSLCSIFLNHEALWCYRRFLIFIYKQSIDSLDRNKNKTEHRLFLHLDKNGVPHRKDFKFDNSEDSEAVPKHSDLYEAFYARLVSSEEEMISKLSSAHDDHVKCLLRNYGLWLKQCFNERFL